MKPTIGRIVHVNVTREESGEALELRPAIITRVWSNTCVNLQVFLDGQNDTVSTPRTNRLQGVSHVDKELGIAWCTSVTQGDGVGEWRWPARD